MKTPEQLKPVDYIEIEDQKILQEDQNFYDQEPFRSILSEVGKKNSIDVSTISPILRLIAIKLKSLDEDIAVTVNDRLSESSFYRGKREIGGQILKEFEVIMDTENKRQLLAEIGSGIKNYPLWHEYIATQSVNYNRDGTPNKTNVKTFVFPETYAFWLKNLQDRRKKIADLETGVTIGSLQEKRRLWMRMGGKIRRIAN